MFEPFPLTLLREISQPERDWPEYGYEMLPVLQWLNGHLAWRNLVLVEDGRGLWAPMLQRLAAGNPAVTCVRANAAELDPWTLGRPDCVHVTAECPPDRLHRLLSVLSEHVAEGGLILLPGPIAAPLQLDDAAIELPVGDGLVLLQASGPSNPLMTWLRGLTDEALLDLGRWFDGLGAHLRPQLDLADMRARAAQASRREASETTLRQRLDHLQENDSQLRAAIAKLTTERTAIHASTAWRATTLLRRMVPAARDRAAAPPAPPPAMAGPDRPDALADFLAGSARLVLPSVDRPALTIILVVEDQTAQLFTCLSAVVAWGTGDGATILIVANGSGAATTRLLARVDGAHILALPERHTAAAAFAAALHVAGGEFILLLDPAMRLRPGSLRAALATLRAASWAGAVCGKVFNVEGAVVQAGETVDASGALHARGRGLPITAPEVQYRHPVPSGTAMFLLVRGRLLRQLGGLSPGFAGTSHAGADVCLRLRGAGWQTLYEPSAEVLLDSTPIREAEPALFALRHAQPAPGGVRCRPAEPGRREQRRLLIIDDRVPYPRLGAGYPRAARIVHELCQLGWRITYFPNYEPYDEWGSVYRQFPREVEFMLGYGRAALGHLLHTRNGMYDTVVVSRPHNMRDYIAARHSAAPPRRLIYDAEAVFVTREFLRLEQAGRSLDPALRQAMLEEEIGLTASADIVTAVNPVEAEIFRTTGGRTVEVLGLGTEPAPISNGYAQRRDLLFVGALGEDVSPNADAVLWFVQEIMPLLDRHIGPAYRLLVAGRCRAPRILALASERVQILGLVDDLSPLYASARAFVAPTRYAAGLPLKVQEAVGHGLPVVGTCLLAQQLGWTAGREMLAAGSADAFAACCARLYSDPVLWYALRRQGLDTLAQETRQDDFAARVDAIFGEGWVAPPG